MRYSGAFSRADVLKRQEQLEQASVARGKDAPLSVREWLAVLVVLAIPGLNVMVPLLWAFGHSRAQLKSFARAILIFEAIGVGIYAVYRWLAPG